jgi:hypothetical protein
MKFESPEAVSEIVGIVAAVSFICFLALEVKQGNHIARATIAVVATFPILGPIVSPDQGG